MGVLLLIMIEEFNEDGKSGLRLTDPENDTRVLDGWLRSLKRELSYLNIVECLEAKNKRLKYICFVAILISFLLFLMLIVLILIRTSGEI